MKIAIISSYFGTSMGGADISTKLLVDGLIKKGINVTIINLKPSFLTFKRILLNINLYDYFLKRYLKKRIKNDTNIIHVHDLMLLPASVEVAQELNIPIIVTVRDYRFISNLPILEVENDLIKKIDKKESIELLKKETKSKLLAYLIYPFIKDKPKKIREALNKCNKIISISDFIKNNLINNNIKKDIITIHNPCPDWKPIKVKHKEIILFSPGRLEYYKGFHILINSINDIIKMSEFSIHSLTGGKHYLPSSNERKILSTKNHTSKMGGSLDYNINNIKLIITGTGNYEKQLKELTNKLKLSNYIEFIGRVSYDKIKDYYFNSDIIIFPSIWPESLGRIPLEAISSGKPVIASNIGGIPEIVNDKTGILVKPNNKEELTKAILKLIKDEKLRKEMGKEASKLYDKFSQESFVNKIINIYKIKYS